MAEEVDRRMNLQISAVTATLLAATIGVFGALAGLVVERLLRSWGRLWCAPSGWTMSFTAWQEIEEGVYGHAAVQDVEKVEQVRYSVTLDLFNGKEIPVGLRDISIVFACTGGEVVDKPDDKDTAREEPLLPGRPHRIIRYEEVGVVNVSPRQWVHKELFKTFDANDERDKERIRLLASWHKVEFVAQRPRHGLFEPKTFRKTIASRPPFADPPHVASS